MPQTVSRVFHLRISRVLLIEAEGLEQLERAPPVVHEHITFQIGVREFIAIHDETARLRQGIDHARVGVEFAVPLHRVEPETADGLQGVAVEEHLAGRPVIRMEACQRPDGTIAHGAGVAGDGTGNDTVSEMLELSLQFRNILLGLLLQRPILEDDPAPGMFLQILLLL